MWTQILLPLLLGMILFIAVIVLASIAAFRENGDVARWAAVSTIWLILPLLPIGLIVLAILCALIYLLGQLIGVIPPYSYQAQRFVYRIAGHIRRGTEMILRPVLFMDAVRSQIQKTLKRQ
ncbi:MAG TPA: hypothetical protein VLX61_03425 [Anaerolineales bacterium]|nr:hypothetical protein [Anaerolineales bacterium]